MGSKRGFCLDAGRRGESRHSVRHAFPSLRMRSDRRPVGASGDFDPLRTLSLPSSSEIQSRGECHRTKSARHDPGFAALKADMSDTSMSDCILSRIARPSSVSPSADSAASRSRIMSSVYSGGSCAIGSAMRRCGGLSIRSPPGISPLTPSGGASGSPSTSPSSHRHPPSVSPSDALPYSSDLVSSSASSPADSSGRTGSSALGFSSVFVPSAPVFVVLSAMAPPIIDVRSMSSSGSAHSFPPFASFACASFQTSSSASPQPSPVASSQACAPAESCETMADCITEPASGVGPNFDTPLSANSASALALRL
mmetsp:Transcript_3677/g.16149  ORF Transcript_3677/g.16149 Transcript_3677/m.16149 type:complete len:311 (+) Transcript_3677:616-1548(+)